MSSSTTATAHSAVPAPADLARAFVTPDRSRARPAWVELPPVQRGELAFDGETLALYQWGTDGSVVVLVHGWDGSHADMAGFVAPLLAAGHRVVAFDLPGHGRSGGEIAPIPVLARAVAAVIAGVGPAEGLIAHSIGCAASAVAVLEEGARVARLAFVAAPARYLDGARALAAQMGYDEAARTAFETELDRLGARLHEMNLPRQAQAATVPALFFHSADDRVVPIAAGRASAGAWPGAVMVELDGLGHARILADPRVIGQAVDFVTRAG
ncbi:alpha/beta fold hydrolase [Tistrella mobilis]|uniref:alpha/beta fold hydrolase n=1 Tax=Tistrella mobilis TaxID=171437 RepID=UPI003556F42B